MEFLLQIALRMWIDGATGWVRWEGQDGRSRQVYVANPCLLVRTAYRKGWLGGHQVFGINYRWSARLADQDGITQAHKEAI